jgi:hypothetical protein
MNKIVKEHYPVERLPADLQAGLPKQGRVRIELEPEVDNSETKPLAGLVGSGRNVHGDIVAILTHTQGLREGR